MIGVLFALLANVFVLACIVGMFSLLYWVLHYAFTGDPVHPADRAKWKLELEKGKNKPVANTEAIDAYFGTPGPTTPSSKETGKEIRAEIKMTGDSFDAYRYVTSWLS